MKPSDSHGHTVLLGKKDLVSATYDAAELGGLHYTQSGGKGRSPTGVAIQPPSCSTAASSRAIAKNLVTGGLGTAMFCMPWSVAGCSILPSMFVIAIVLLANAWTISILVRAADRYQEFNLGSLLRHLPGGKLLEAITNILVWVSLFLCLASYVIVMHDSASKFLNGTFLSSRPVIVTLASICVLPLCFLDQRRLESTSSLAIAINGYLLFLLAGLCTMDGGAHQIATSISSGTSTAAASPCLLGSTVRGMFAMSSVMFQAVVVQMCVLPMYEELEDRSPEKMDSIVAGSFATLFVIFLCFSVLGYLYAGPAVESNILLNLPRGRWTDYAQCGTILVVACVYPVMLYPMISALPIKNDSHRDSSSGDGVVSLGAMGNLPVTFVKVAIVASAGVAALICKDLGSLNVINGAVSSGFFVAILPAAVGFYLLDLGAHAKVSLLLILVIGLVLAGCGLIFRDNYVSDLTCYVYA